MPTYLPPERKRNNRHLGSTGRRTGQMVNVWTNTCTDPRTFSTSIGHYDYSLGNSISCCHYAFLSWLSSLFINLPIHVMVDKPSVSYMTWEEKNVKIYVKRCPQKWCKPGIHKKKGNKVQNEPILPLSSHRFHPCGQKCSILLVFFLSRFFNSNMAVALNPTPLFHFTPRTNVRRRETRWVRLDQELWVEMMRMRFTGAAACCPHGWLGSVMPDGELSSISPLPTQIATFIQSSHTITP